MNALVDAKRAKSFNNALKMVTANVELTHQRLRTLENRTSMMAKAIMPALDDLKSRIANMNQKLTSQHRMMQMAHHRYNLLFRWMHETLTIHIVTFITFFLKYHKTIQAMLAAFITTNTSGILPTKANPIGIMFCPFLQ